MPGYCVFRCYATHGITPLLTPRECLMSFDNNRFIMRKQPLQHQLEFGVEVCVNVVSRHWCTTVMH